jgi:hypothetical protein
VTIAPTVKRTAESAAAAGRIVTLRREDLESRFLGLVDVILRDAA